jgi:dynein heavy chain
VKVASFRAPIREVMQSFDVLDEFGYRLPKELFRLRWTTFGWPKQVHDQLTAKDTQLQVDRTQFLGEMRAQQEEFKAELIDVEKKVNTFGQYTQLDKIVKIAQRVEEIKKQLDALEARAHAFNASELLFNVPATDYRDVNKVSKNFEPYYILWTTANEWLKNHEIWRTDSFMHLNGDDVATKVNTYMKNLAKVIKTRPIKSNPGCLAIATQIKKEVEAFRPNLPLIIALLNPGMRQRHWDMLNEKLPFEFKPDETLTLTKVTEELQMGKYLDIISKVHSAEPVCFCAECLCGYRLVTTPRRNSR